jgi:hypothetical protein
MTELRIECLALRADAPDLGLALRRGEVAWLPLGSLDTSACLRALKNMGAVSVVSAQRCATMRNPAPPASRLTRKPPIKRIPAAAPVAPLAPQDIDARIQQAVDGAVDRLAERLFAALGNAPSPKAALDEEAISRAVSSAVSSVLAQQGAGGTVAGSTPRVAGPADPVYIPTGIVSDTPVDFQVAAQAADAGDLAGAASALRKTRTRKTTGTTE